MGRCGISVGLLFALAVACSAESEGGGEGGSGAAGNAGSAGADGSVTAGSAGAGASGGNAGAGASGGSAGAGATGGGAGAGGAVVDAGDGGATEWDDYCTAAAAQHAGCGVAFDCVAAACVYSGYQADLVDDYASCLLQRSCSGLGSDDDCFSATGRVDGKYPPADQARIDACVSRASECPGALGSDDCAVFAPLIGETHAAAAELCLAKPCAEIAGCLSAVFAAFDCFDD